MVDTSLELFADLFMGRALTVTRERFGQIAYNRTN